MTFVVMENCIKCKYTDCVEVCPVDCFHEGPNFLVIDPDECIDCTLCEPECPAEAIVSEDDLPDDQAVFLELNAELAKVWPVITEQIDPPAPDAVQTHQGPAKGALAAAGGSDNTQRLAGPQVEAHPFHRLEPDRCPGHASDGMPAAHLLNLQNCLPIGALGRASPLSGPR